MNPLGTEPLPIVIVSLSSSVKYTLTLLFPAVEFSFSDCVNVVTTEPPTDVCLHLGAVLGVTLMYIVFEPTPLNVSTASTKKGCEPLPGVLSVFKDDVDLVFRVTAPADDILNLSAVYALAVLNVIDCPSASVAATVPTDEPLTTNSPIVNPLVVIEGTVFGKNTFL